MATVIFLIVVFVAWHIGMMVLQSRSSGTVETHRSNRATTSHGVNSEPRNTLELNRQVETAENRDNPTYASLSNARDQENPYQSLLM